MKRETAVQLILRLTVTTALMAALVAALDWWLFGHLVPWRYYLYTGFAFCLGLILGHMSNR